MSEIRAAHADNWRDKQASRAMVLEIASTADKKIKEAHDERDAVVRELVEMSERQLAEAFADRDDAIARALKSEEKRIESKRACSEKT